MCSKCHLFVYGLCEKVTIKQYHNKWDKVKQELKAEQMQKSRSISLNLRFPWTNFRKNKRRNDKQIPLLEEL